MSTTGTLPGVRIVDMPDLGVVTDGSSVVGELAGSGRFGATALRTYMGATFATSAAVAAARFGASVKEYGAVGNGTTDDTAALQAAINAVQGTGCLLHLPAGKYLVSGTLHITAPISMVGVGAGIGPGIVSSVGCSQILCAPAFTSGDVISVVTYYSCNFRDFQIAAADGLTQTSNSPRGAGAGLHISAPNPGTSTNECSMIEGICFSGLDVGLQCTICTDHVVRGCYFQAFKSAAYYAEGANRGIEANVGHLSNNKFFGNATAGTTQVAAIVTTQGYGTIVNNVIVGSQYGIRFTINELNVGSMFIRSNTIEEQTVCGIQVSQTGSWACSCCIINGNEFSNITNTGLTAHIQVVAANNALLYNLDISDNNFNSNLAGGSAACINAQGGTQATVNNNRFNINSCYAILLGGSGPLQVSLMFNRIQGAPTGTGYLTNSSALIHDLLSRRFTVALLPAAVQNGSMLWATDGHATSLTSPLNSTVIGGGGGCLAHFNAVWRTTDP